MLLSDLNSLLISCESVPGILSIGYNLQKCSKLYKPNGRKDGRPAFLCPTKLCTATCVRLLKLTSTLWPLNLSVNVLLGDLYSVRPSAIPSVTIVQIEGNRRPSFLDCG